MDLADIVRMAVLLFGGAVVGAGVPIMHMRSEYYKDIGMRHGQHACRWLLLVNVLALGFVSSVLITRWGNNLSWYWVFALSVFVTKACMFHQLRALTIEDLRRQKFAAG